MPARGLFIVLEGADGCGKSTQTRLLAERLSADGVDVVATREPGATPVGAVIRGLVLDPRAGGPGLDARTEALLVAADRAEHVATVIRPALARGALVLSDRYVPSSLAYQGVARGLGVEAVERLSGWATGGLAPDVVVVLDVDGPTATARRAAREPVGEARSPSPIDRIEAEPAAFAEAVRRAYRELGPRRGWVTVDGTAPVADVALAVWAAVAPVLTRR